MFTHFVLVVFGKAHVPLATARGRAERRELVKEPVVDRGGDRVQR
jgi:hypothetical protein